MKPNLQDYPKFYRWLTLPFTRKPHRVQVLQRTNRILTFAMPGIYGLVFCWLFFKKTSMGDIWPFIWIPASGFVLFSLFRHWVNVPRPYEKWEIQPLLEKNSSNEFILGKDFLIWSFKTLKDIQSPTFFLFS